ncbi:hypothetical protein [Streptomyces sp. NPDC050738]|uniref:hypothetical protein n=1 Tax=Streptomyces sp. NPDC050738 TaxID=3154744 RepID=UPI00343E7487
MSLGDEREHGYDSVGGAGQTRTRLPEGEGSRPPAARMSRSVVTVVGVVVLLIAAIAFANRGGGEDDSPSGTDKKAGANPTAATGSKPVTGKNGPIPSGYAKSDQGAQSAATNYAVALGSDGMFRTDSRHQIVDTVYAPDVAATNQGALDKVYSGEKFLTSIGLKADGSAPSGMTFISRTNPVGSKTEKFDGDTASVSVWYSTLFGLAGEGSTNPVAESWYTNTFALKWVDDDWKVTGVTQKDGPTPVGRDQAASSAKDMSDAVHQFGGFTYAR